VETPTRANMTTPQINAEILKFIVWLLRPAYIVQAVKNPRIFLGYIV